MSLKNAAMTCYVTWSMVIVTSSHETLSWFVGL